MITLTDIAETTIGILVVIVYSLVIYKIFHWKRGGSDGTDEPD